MRIEVKCYATLSKFTPEANDRFELPDGSTAGDLLAILGIDPAEVKLLFVNGVNVKADRPLVDGDRVGLFPAVGGG